jgi:hypothetical protein
MHGCPYEELSAPFDEERNRFDSSQVPMILNFSEHPSLQAQSDQCHRDLFRVSQTLTELETGKMAFQSREVFMQNSSQQVLYIS